MVGRDHEVSALCAEVERGRSVVVTGNAGVGKTAAMRAAVERLGVHAFEGAALHTLRWMSYLSVARALARRPPAEDHEGVAEWVAGQIGPGALILDDIQWADGDTLALVPLLRNRIRLLVGLRTGEPGAAAVERQITDEGMMVLELQPLGTDQVAKLVERRWPDLSGDDVTRIAHAAGGNPRLAEELAKDGGKSTSFRLVTAARIRRLSPAARETLGALGLLRRPGPRDLFSEAAQELVDGQLALGGRGCVEALHPMFGEIALEQLDSAQQRALHAQIARGVADPGEAARHFAEAGELESAYSRAIEAAALAEDAEERATHLAVAATCAQDPGANQLRLRAARALIAVGRYGASHELLENVAGSNALTGAEAALHRARCLVWLRESDSAKAQVERGLRLATGSESRVEVDLKIERARIALLDHDLPQALKFLDQARSDPVALGMNAVALQLIEGMARFLAPSAQCVDDFRAVIEEASDGGDSDLEFEASACLVRALQEFGNPQAALPLAERMLARARLLHLRGWESAFRYLVARLEVFRRGPSQPIIRELDELLQGAPLGSYHPGAAALLSLSLAYAGREADARARVGLEAASATTPWARASLLLAQAEVEWLTGRPALAVEAVGKLRAIADDGYESLRTLGALIQAWALFDLGRPPDQALRVAEYPAVEGAVIESRALVRCRDDRRLSEAESLFEKAAETWARDSVSAQARCLWAAGEAARLAGDTERACTRLRAVEDHARSFGLTGLLSRIQSSIRKTGRAAARPPPAGRRGVKHGDLTPREREILRLVGAGLSSRDIAELLSIAQSTVETQIRSAMRKLGATTRVHAATLVWFRAEDALLDQDKPTDELDGPSTLAAVQESVASSESAGALVTAETPLRSTQQTSARS